MLDAWASSPVVYSSVRHKETDKAGDDVRDEQHARYAGEHRGSEKLSTPVGAWPRGEKRGSDDAKEEANDTGQQ